MVKNQDVVKNANERALRENFDSIQEQIFKWNEAYPSIEFERDEESGIHYILEAVNDYKVSTNSGSTI